MFVVGNDFKMNGNVLKFVNSNNLRNSLPPEQNNNKPLQIVGK